MFPLEVCGRFLLPWQPNQEADQCNFSHFLNPSTQATFSTNWKQITLEQLLFENVKGWTDRWTKSDHYEGRAKSSVTNRLPLFYPRYILKCFTALEWCFFFFLIWILRPFQEYFTYIEPIVHRRWAKTGEPGEKPPDHP